MPSSRRDLDALRWNGEPGHYEVYYLTLTDPQTGIGVWIRYAMLAPLPETGEPASCALWFASMDPTSSSTMAYKTTFPIERLRARSGPLELHVGDGVLSDRGMAGEVGGASWDLSWAPSSRGYEHIHPLLQRFGVAKTVLTLPGPALSIDGTVNLPGRRLELRGAPGGQAHLWGSEHAASWAWVHCNDLRSLEGELAPGTFVDGISARTHQLGRELGPSTAVVGRIDDEEFRSTSPLRILANWSSFALTGWLFEVVGGALKLVGEVDADRDQLVGVTYSDPDGEPAYCYNSETASMRLRLYERSRRVGGWSHRKTLVSDGRAHFEYGQRLPVPGMELKLR